MTEELNTVNALLRRIEHPHLAASITGHAGAADGPAGDYPCDVIATPPAEGSGEHHQSLWGLSWRNLGRFSVRGLEFGEMFSFQGVATGLIIDHVVPWAYHQAKSWYQTQRAEKRAAQRGPYRLFELEDVNLDAGYQDFLDFRVQGFAQPGWYLPLWSAHSPGDNGVDWTKHPGAPAYLTGQDGYFN